MGGVLGSRQVRRRPGVTEAPQPPGDRRAAGPRLRRILEGVGPRGADARLRERRGRWARSDDRLRTRRGKAVGVGHGQPHLVGARRGEGMSGLRGGGRVGAARARIAELPQPRHDPRAAGARGRGVGECRAVIGRVRGDLEGRGRWRGERGRRAGVERGVVAGARSGIGCDR